MSTDKAPENVYLILRLSIQQQTDHIQSSISKGFCEEGEFFGAYELRTSDQIVPLLVIEGLDNELDTLGNTHLQVITIPRAQVGGQGCTPFHGREISSLFKKFVGYTQSKIAFSMPDEIRPEQYRNVYIPRKKSDLLVVEKCARKQQDVRYLRWGLTGYLVLDRFGRGFEIDEPVMTFDPEVIVDTGED